MAVISYSIITKRGIIIISDTTIKQFMPKTILFLLVLLTLACHGQKFDKTKLDSFWDALEKKKMAFGSVAVSKNGKMMYSRTLGYSYMDSSEKNPTSAQTRYRIGSVTKMFTAVVIFQMIEEGKIQPQKKLSDYFPALPNSKNISIEDLLYHRSGLHNYTEGTGFNDWMDKPTSQEQLLKIIEEKGADFAPGSKAEYSNTNYLLLSYIIEKIDGAPYEASIKKRIVEKIKLADTYYGHAIDRKKNEASSYKYVNGDWKAQKETELSIHKGAGAVVSTPADMLKFIEALFSYRLVSRANVNLMITLKDGYGMGIFPFVHDDKTAYGHNGRIEEFYSSVRYFPDEKLSVAYVTNGILYPRTDIIDGVLKICFGEPFETPFSSDKKPSSKELGKYVGKYASDAMPIVVQCTVDSNKLVAETQGTKFELIQINESYFMHPVTGYFFQFFPAKNELQIKETDNVYYLKRQ